MEVLTDTGWNTFGGVVFKGRAETALLTLERDSLIITLGHGIYTDKSIKVEARCLKPGQKIKTSTGLQQVVSLAVHDIVEVYDLLNVGNNHRFYANNILSSNCEFLIADETLINPNTLFTLQGIEPVNRQGQVRWYKKPEKGHIYLVALDPSLGTGGDPAAIQIFEANTTTQIGEWKHNKTDIPGQIKLITQINTYITECTGEPNNLYYSVENNSIGEAALISLNEYGEQNIPGNFMSEPGKKRKGFNTTNKTKLAACAKFKTLLESKKMTINSYGLITELKSFISSGASFAAKLGDTDDLVMSTLLITRMLVLLGEYNYDLDEHIRDHDNIIMPLPFFAVFA